MMCILVLSKRPMASLQHKGDSWYCQFRFDGKRRTYALGRVSESEAKTTAARIDYLLMRLRQRLMELPAGMDVLTFVEHDGKPPAVPKPTVVATRFGELRKRYLETFGNGALERNTLDTAKIHLNHLGETLGTKFPLSDLKFADLQRHIERRQKKVSPTTIKKEIDTFRAAWNWACRMALTQGSFPSTGLVYPKAEDKLPFMTFEEIERRIAAGGEPDELWECLYLTHTEIIELLDHVQGRALSSWIYPAFVMAAHAGTRRSEMLRMRPEDVDIPNGVITIREKKRVKGRRTTRRVPLSERLATALTSWLKERQIAPALFCRGTKALSPQTMQKSFARGVRQSKWEVLRGWHVLRHSFISALASQGVDQRIIDEFVGHQTEEQRRRYRHLYPSTQKDAIRSVFG